jgi:SPP1 gp7 family putative phage head morphogenesis protein
MPLYFGKSAAYHKQLTATEEKRIKKIYKNAANEISKQISKVDPNNSSTSYKLNYLNELRKQIDEAYSNVSIQVKSEITNSIYDMSKFVVTENNDILKPLNLDIKAAFSYVPKDVVTSITTGTLYNSKQFLSQRIWGIESKTGRDVRYIVSQGLAQNKSTYEIAKDLEKYVTPGAKKDWEWSKVYPGTTKTIDYNAQRLARTMITHGYQQSVKEVAQQNPLASGIKWLASGGPRMCDICAERDGKIFAPDDLPLDHPNGMCTMAVYFEKSLEQTAKEVATELGQERDELQAKLNQLRENAQNPSSPGTT